MAFLLDIVHCEHPFVQAICSGFISHKSRSLVESHNLRESFSKPYHAEDRKAPGEYV